MLEGKHWKRDGLRALTLGLVVGGLASLSGCAASGGGQRLGGYGGFADVRVGGGATAGAALTAWERSAGSGSEDARFTYGRRDTSLSVRQSAPLLATGEWPVPARPAERRIIFRRYVQR